MTTTRETNPHNKTLNKGGKAMKPIHFVLQNGLGACLYTHECTETQATRLIKTLVGQAPRFYSRKHPWGLAIKSCYLVEVKLQQEKAYLVYLWSRKPSATPKQVVSDLTLNLVSEVNRVSYVAYHKKLYAACEDFAPKIKDALLNGVPVEINALLQD
jgi:hypothetical protein